MHEIMLIIHMSDVKGVNKHAIFSFSDTRNSIRVFNLNIDSPLPCE